MKPLVNNITLLATLSLLATPTLADQDQIGPAFLGFGQTLDLNFPNQTLPQPSRKVLQFAGMAEASGPPGVAAILGMHFDYIDTNGNQQIIPLPNFYQAAIQTGAGLVPISAGPVQLPYCPDQVSIHFENLTEFTEIEFQGIYDHTCVPVPEPGTAALAMLCGVASLSWRRKMR